ncbi:MAG TPA: hypothetical protein VND23_12145 [Acidimicrobiales bacterium]|nr:hypothetical protein [Acidimicrobiales bacterium]
MAVRVAAPAAAPAAAGCFVAVAAGAGAEEEVLAAEPPDDEAPVDFGVVEPVAADAPVAVPDETPKEIWAGFVWNPSTPASPATVAAITIGVLLIAIASIDVSSGRARHA